MESLATIASCHVREVRLREITFTFPLTIKRREEEWRNWHQNARAAACHLGCNFILTIRHFTMKFYTVHRRVLCIIRLIRFTK